MPSEHYLTDVGHKHRERLQETFEIADHMDLARVRELWILTQYQRGKTAPMEGPVMGPLFRELVNKGYIETYGP